MPKRSVPRYCLHRPSGQARVRIDGKDHYLGLYGSPKSKAEYGKLIAGWQAKTNEAPKNLLIRDLAYLYLEHCGRHYRKNGAPTTELQPIRDALKRLLRLYVDERVADFQPRMLKQVRQAMIEEGLARSTINGGIGRIRRMFKWGVGEDLVPASVLVGLQAVRDLERGRSDAREPDPVRPVPIERVDAIKPYVSRPVWGLIQFQLTTGARPGEALIARGCDINVSGHVWEFTPMTHKTEHHGKERVIFIGPRGKEVVRQFLSTDLHRYLFCPHDAITDLVARAYRRGARIRGDVGDRYTLHSYAAAIRRGCELAFGMPDELRNINKALTKVSAAKKQVTRERLLRAASEWRRENCWSANQLRHTFATQARRQFGIEAARVTLGHASAVTSEIYAERDFEAARKVVAQIG